VVFVTLGEVLVDVVGVDRAPADSIYGVQQLQIGVCFLGLVFVHLGDEFLQSLVDVCLEDIEESLRDVFLGQYLTNEIFVVLLEFR